MIELGEILSFAVVSGSTELVSEVRVMLLCTD